MSSFVLVRSKVLDPEGYQRYRSLAGPSVAAHGGQFVLKGAVVQQLEEEDFADRVAVIAFPSAGAARSWFGSAAYQEARAAREGAGPMALTLIEGA